MDKKAKIRPMSPEDSSWEDFYIKTKPEALPWNAGGPDPDLVRLVRSGQIPAGQACLTGRQALDIGTGPGHDAVFLMQQGFNIIAIDTSSYHRRWLREKPYDYSPGTRIMLEFGELLLICVTVEVDDVAPRAGSNVEAVSLRQPNLDLTPADWPAREFIESEFESLSL